MAERQESKKDRNTISKANMTGSSVNVSAPGHRLFKILFLAKVQNTGHGHPDKHG